MGIDSPKRLHQANPPCVKVQNFNRQRRRRRNSGVRSVIPFTNRRPSFTRNCPNYDEYYCDKGLSIVGYFHANERFDDSELGSVAKNIADHIYRYFPQAALLLLYTKDASRSWKLVGSDESSCLKIKEPSANVVLLDYISSGKWKDIIDFDDDLDDISKDWVNTELFN